MAKSEQEWAAFHEALGVYFSVDSNLGSIPPKKYEWPAANGVLVKLGKDINNYRDRGIPEGCPDHIRKFMEDLGVAGDNHFEHPNHGKNKTADEWAAFREALDGYYSVPGNLNTIPSKGSYEWPASNGVVVKLGQDITNYRHRGIPAGCPEAIRMRLQELRVVGDDRIQVPRGRKRKSAGVEEAPQDAAGPAAGPSGLVPQGRLGEPEFSTAVRQLGPPAVTASASSSGTAPAPASGKPAQKRRLR